MDTAQILIQALSDSKRGYLWVVVAFIDTVLINKARMTFAARAQLEKITGVNIVEITITSEMRLFASLDKR